MRTLALSKTGKIFTWGCNDEGALGRNGDEEIPMEVEVEPIKYASCGDSHSLVLATSGNVYIFGCFRDGNGQMSE